MLDLSPAEKVVIAAIYRDGISPSWLLERINHPQSWYPLALQELGGEPPSDEAELMAILIHLAQRGFVQPVNYDGTPRDISTVPAPPYTEDDLRYGLWFELTSEGDVVGEELQQRFFPLPN